MSSHSSITNVASSSPLAPFPPYSSAGFAGSNSSSSTAPFRGDNRIIRPSFSDLPDGPTNADAARERSRASLMSMDRKRRLTTTASDDATSHRRPSALSGPSSSSHGRLQQDRPLPMLPVDDERNDYYASSSMPGSSRENAIDLTSPSSVRDTTGSFSRQHSRSLPTVHQHQRQSPMEYTLPRWQPDSEVTHCPICSTQFSFWYRKHHCRKCGRVVCASCSPHRITIPRQYIVRPPEPTEHLTSETHSHHRRTSSREVDFTDDETYDSATVTTAHPENHSVNPALGGGEEVRLCNPCVPDPNPNPPLLYGTGRTTFERLPGPDWGETMPAVPISQRFHQVRRSLSGAQIFGPRRDLDREIQDHHQRRQALEEFLGNRTSTTPIEPSFGQHSDSSRSQIYTRGQSHSFSTHRPGPFDSEYRSSVFDTPGTRPRRVRSLVDSDQTRAARPPHRVRVDERDLCPICSTQLPSRARDGNEDEREAHIRDCIARSSGADRSSPGMGSPQSQHLLRMLSFTATEKDCLGEDSTLQECTICMEEYEVGDKLVRLECLCKFHKTCIVGWFERKKECPVHKFS